MMIGANSPYHAAKQRFEQKAQRGANEMLALFNAARPADSAGSAGLTAAGNTLLAPKEAARRLPLPEHSAGGLAKPAPARSDVVAEFLEYASKSTAEKMREQILKAMGLTEEDLENMSPEQRKAVEAQIAQMMRDKIEEAARERQAEQAAEGQDSPLASGDGAQRSLLSPTVSNIRRLAESAQAKLDAARAQYGVEGEFTIRFDEGKGAYRIEPAQQTQLAKEQRRALERLLSENPLIERELQAVAAMSSLHAALQERQPFIEEYQAARTPAETQAAVEKYSHWFGASAEPQADIHLSYGQDGLKVMIHHQPVVG